MQHATHSCVLCGTLSRAPLYCTNSERMQSTVREHCAPSYFVYQSILSDSSPVLETCAPCTHWLSRISKKPRRHGKKKSTIPMDVLIFFLAHPHVNRPPDIRATHRLIAALGDNVGGFKNRYLSFPLVRDAMGLIAASTQRTIKDKICDAWWTLNGNCDVFSNDVVSSAVRRLRKPAPPTSWPATPLFTAPPPPPPPLVGPPPPPLVGRATSPCSSPNYYTFAI